MLDQCFVLIPSTTLEDFPKQTTDEHARGLLAAWTAPWHPRVLASVGRLPQWFRADTLPPKLDQALILVPDAASQRLPSRFADETAAAADCVVVRGGCRGDFLTGLFTALGLDESLRDARCDAAERVVGGDDFFALGYTWLQIQLMTRRLRYTSNLDEVYFAGRVIAAATAVVEDRGDEAVAALHEAFDCLAEERDHYFSNDPHLIDLTLLATTTLAAPLERSLALAAEPDQPPTNFLIGPAVAAAIAAAAGDHPESACGRLRQALIERRFAIAGGGPDGDVNLHHLTSRAAAAAIAASRAELERHLGVPCVVYARAAGETPGDLGPLLAAAGFRGAIPIDLAAGSGWREESKLIWESGHDDLDALVARPIDASCSVGFLALGPNLGQSIDSGEIATALLVHWPGDLSDAYRDLRRAASWGLALGRFWKLDDYFVDGERPFHHYRGRADEGAGDWLQRVVDGGAVDPLSSAAADFRDRVIAESADAIAAMAKLVNPDTDSVENSSLLAATERLCVALGGKPLTTAPSASDDGAAAERLMWVNPHPIGVRVPGRLSGGPPAGEPNDAAGGKRHLFGWTAADGGGSDVTVDVTGGGFVFLDGTGRAPRRNWFKRRRRIASAARLSNEFMELELSPKTGGVSGVYSGAGRGNRLSLRLTYQDETERPPGAANGAANGATGEAPAERSDTMVADSVEVIRSDEAVGEIRAKGRLFDIGGQSVARFSVTYRLRRGSRWLEIASRLDPEPTVILGANPWRSYFGWRAAVAADASAVQVSLRDRLHRAGSGRKLDAPAGLLIDEVERQTLLYANGSPAFRRVGDRFVDSLVMVRGETARDSTLAIGFDVPEPVAALRAQACPPPCLPVSSQPASTLGWLVNCSATDVMLSDLQITSERPLVLTLTVIATVAESRKVKLRFCRDCVSAERLTGNPGPQPVALNHSGDQVEVALAGHDAIRVRVTLAR